MVMKTKLFITGIALMALTTIASAQNQGAGRRVQNSNEKGIAFVDSNKDGICDNLENRSSGNQSFARKGNCKGCGNGPANSTGRKNMRQGAGNKSNFVDADKNGICDNREAASKN
jgi:hypothetical protein